MAQQFVKIAVVYLLIGGLLGLGMGVAGNFLLVPVHAHLLLLGWVSLALAGVIYTLYPEAGSTRLAKVHFWLHNLGLPAFMVSLAVMLGGRAELLPVVAASGTVVVAGLAVFTLNVLRHVRPAGPMRTSLSP